MEYINCQRCGEGEFEIGKIGKKVMILCRYCGKTIGVINCKEEENSHTNKQEMENFNDVINA